VKIYRNENGQLHPIADWDGWFAGTEEFRHKRDSKEFSVLVKLWDQFKKQVLDV
jgi:uncharacterized membrane protein YsdA (DUF1294 family)